MLACFLACLAILAPVAHAGDDPFDTDDVPGPEAEVELAWSGLAPGSRSARLEHFRIDEDHSNAFTAWKKMGSPQQPTVAQYTQLEKAGHLATLGEAQTVRVNGGASTVKFKLPRQGVSLLKLTY